MQTGEYSIRTMTRAQLDIAVNWAAAEGWNPGLCDAARFHAADPEGFLVGMLDEVPIASISAVRYGTTFGFIGFYIVKPEHRGKGFGLRIWNAALARLEGRTIGLDGVIAQQPNYRKAGFQLAYRNIRFQGTTPDIEPTTDPEIVSLDAVPVETVLAYDQPFFADDRTSFLKAWVRQPGCPGLGIFENGNLAGYGVIRPCRDGYKVGPLFADNADLANRLFVALQSRVGGGLPVFLDIPEVNPRATALVKNHGMTPMFETARMYKGTPPNPPLDRLFGVTTFELG